MDDNTLIMYFFASWCAPSLMYKLSVESLEKEYSFLTVMKYDLQKSPMLIKNYNITTLPTMYVYSDGSDKPIIMEGEISIDTIKDIIKDNE